MSFRTIPSCAIFAALLFCACLASAGGQITPAENPPVGSVKSIQKSASIEPFKELPVHAKGVVTWVDVTAGRQFYIYDGSGGILVAFDKGAWPNYGDIVEIDGILTRGPFAPIIAHATFRQVDRGHFPTPIGLAEALRGDFLDGYFNGEPVAVEGWVRSAQMVTPTTLAAELNAGPYRIKISVSNVTNLDPEKLISQRVQVRGVANPIKARGAIQRLVEGQVLAANFPPQIPHYISQLIEVEILVPRQDDLHLSRLNTISPWTRPLIKLENAFRYVPGGPVRGDWVHVQGEVVLWKDGITYLSDGANGLAVRGPPAASLHRGEWVDAVGYPDFDGSLPILSDAMIRPSGDVKNPVVPKEKPAASLLDDAQHASYVSVTGKLLDRMQAPKQPASSGDDGETTLVLALQSPHDVFTAELKSKGGGQPLLPQVEIGSILKVSGVCLVQTDTAGIPTAFKILVPSPDQITVIKPASFFTVKRLLVLLSLTLAVLLVFTLLTYFFARRNIRLRAEMHERQAVAAERNRLARDLHDTLEQGLTGIQFQLQSIGPSEDEASPETQARLDTVRSLIEQCHAETRQSIWNLRSVAHEYFDLGDALERAARSLVLGSEIQVELRQQRDDSGIPPLIEDNLLRIGQEALTNAVKHARASRLKIDLVATPNSVSLTINDNGQGLTEPRDRPGHFGLLGMRERADRIGGELAITNDPSAGCSVRVIVPLSSHN